MTILLPVVLMLTATIADVSSLRPGQRGGALDRLRWKPAGGDADRNARGAPRVRDTCGFSLATILRFVEDSLGPIASVLLIVGAGGGFGRVLEQAGVGQAIATTASGLHCAARRGVDPRRAAAGRGRLRHRRDHDGRQPDGANCRRTIRQRTASSSSSRSAPARSSPRTSTTAGSGWSRSSSASTSARRCDVDRDRDNHLRRGLCAALLLNSLYPL